MKTVWKFSLEVADEQILHLPYGAEILSVGLQAEVIVLWALVDPAPDAPKKSTCIVIRGTGQSIETSLFDLAYIGTVHFLNGIVNHVFRRDC